jgi:hypothetical protein
MTAKKQSSTQLAPDKAPLTESQTIMLSALTGIDASKFKGLSVAELSSEFRWQIDPNLFLFVRVCGQVVKQNPATGNQDPVPFATVYAEETICSLLGRFPVGLPWVWFFPFECHTEVVAQTTTDACGKFCIWVPRFEIEWILRFRLERICYLQLFNKPTVASVLAFLQGNPTGPDPAPDAQATVKLKPGTALYQKAEQLLGTQVTLQLAAQRGDKAFGSATTGQQSLLARPAFATAIAPALPKEFRKPASLSSAEKHRNAVASTLANNLGLDVNQFEGLDLNRYCGPFLRCFDIIVPEWVPIFEVPDISFRVTQDVDGTGAQQVIYSGGLFDVAWSTGGVSSVTLLASPIAFATTSCSVPNVPCGDLPSLEFVGLMPLVNPPFPGAPYVDAIAGFATRPNPPHPDGTIGGAALPPSTAPYTGTLQLYGCNQVDGAVYYRLRYTYTALGSTTPSALTPFTGLTWPVYREIGTTLETLWPVSDASGWYPVLASADGWFPPNLMLEWDTTSFADGLYTVQLEVADGSKTVLATSSKVGFVVDNSLPISTYSAIWSFSPDMSGSQPVPAGDCVVIDRGETPVSVYVQVSYSVTAKHLRSAQLISSGCNNGANLNSAVSPPPLTQPTPTLAVQHWYENSNDSTFSVVANYVIPSSYPQGVYSFDMYSDTRAFNPAGSDAGPLDDWNYNPVYKWTEPNFSIAIVNA